MPIKADSRLNFFKVIEKAIDKKIDHDKKFIES